MGTVSSLHPRIIESADFAEYMIATEPKQKVLPASAFIEELKRSLRPGYQSNIGVLPWPKTHSAFAFRPGEVTLWAGINGHGKSMMLSQVVLSLCSQGQRACVASFEMKPFRQLQRLIRQASGGDEITDEWADVIGQFLDGKLWFYDQQGTVKMDAVYAVCRYCAEKLGIRHLVIDSLMKCVRGDDDYNGQKQLVDELTAIARDTDMHIHLVHHVRKASDENSPPGKFDAKGSGAITDQVDNVMIVWRNKAKEADIEKGKDVSPSTPDALLICDKQRNGEWEGRISLWFHKGAMQYTPDRFCEPMDLLRVGA